MADRDPSDPEKAQKKENKRARSPLLAVVDLQANENVKRWSRRYRTEIASASSSMLSTFIAFPLDFAKSRMQSYQTGFLDTIKDAYKAEGLRGFWRGVSTPLLSVMAVRTISFSIYQRSKYTLDSWMTKTNGESPLSIANTVDKYPTLSTIFCFSAAGASAGALITFVSCPFELIKLHAQLAGKMAREANPSDRSAPISNLRTGAFRTAKHLLHERGLSGLYCGYRLHLVRDTIGTAMYFGTYESVKQILSNGRGNSPTDPGAVAFAGATCGIVSWTLIYPIDVVKTVYQKHALASGTNGKVSRSKIKFFHMGSYRGLGVSVLRSALINMIFFSSFEQIKKRINAIDD